MKLFTFRSSSARMVPLRHPPANVGHGVGLLGLRDGRWPPLDGQQEAVPDSKHTSRLQRLPSAALVVHVL